MHAHISPQFFRMPQLLIFGETIMNRLLDEKEIWQPFQKSYTAVNFAVAGERADTLLYRIKYSDWNLLSAGKEGMREELSPLVVIIMIGTHDVGNGDSPEKVVASIDAVVRECVAKIPQVSNIFVLSILPRALDSFNTVIAEINKRINEMYADTKLLNGAITAVDLTPLFKAKDGAIKLNMYLQDRFHPSKQGYSSLVRAVRPLFDEIFVAHKVSAVVTGRGVGTGALRGTVMPNAEPTMSAPFVVSTTATTQQQDSLFQGLQESLSEQ